MKKMSKLKMLVIVVVMLGMVLLSAAPGFAFGWRAFVEKTGQTTQYESGDDGDLQRGVRWPKPRFIDLKNGWVFDRLTWLQWLKDANCASTIGLDPDGRMDWQSALDFVEDLNDGVHDCGQTNLHWKPARLPNVKELQSLIHYGFGGPALPNTAGTGHWTEGDPFTGVVPAGFYWSSTTYVGGHDHAWYVSWGSGFVDWGMNKAGGLYVWPVRGGK